jgi:hypothetical protein
VKYLKTLCLAALMTAAVAAFAQSAEAHHYGGCHRNCGGGGDRDYSPGSGVQGEGGGVYGGARGNFTAVQRAQSQAWWQAQPQSTRDAVWQECNAGRALNKTVLLDTIECAVVKGITALAGVAPAAPVSLAAAGIQIVNVRRTADQPQFLMFTIVSPGGRSDVYIDDANRGHIKGLQVSQGLTKAEEAAVRAAVAAF